MYGEEATQAGAPGSTTIQTRCDQLEKLCGQAHEVLTELEARISPILQQEVLEVVKADMPMNASDHSAVVTQRLATVQIQLSRLVDRIHMLTIRSEV